MLCGLNNKSPAFSGNCIFESIKFTFRYKIFQQFHTGFFRKIFTFAENKTSVERAFIIRKIIVSYIENSLSFF